MSKASRNAILDKLRGAARRDGDEAAARAAVDTRLRTHARGTIPARGKLDREGLIDLFAAQAVAVDATVARVAALDDVPATVADYLRGENLPTKLRLAPDPKLDACSWDQAPMLDIVYGKAEAEDMVTVTGAFAGIAESGTMMLVSGPETPTTLNFLPDTHIVVLRASEMVGAYEDAWDRLRNTGRMPRTVNLITGPSRSGDIEQTLHLGAHGPRRLHVILVEDDG
jgi:L-lactate dehydrogenase complex protein LldG